MRVYFYFLLYFHITIYCPLLGDGIGMTKGGCSLLSFIFPGDDFLCKRHVVSGS